MNIEKQEQPPVVYHKMFGEMKIVSHKDELKIYDTYCLTQNLDPNDKKTVVENFETLCCLFPEDNEVLQEIELMYDTGIYSKWNIQSCLNYIAQTTEGIDVMKIVTSQYIASPNLPRMVFWGGRHELPDASELAKLPKLSFMGLDRKIRSSLVYTKNKEFDCEFVELYDELMKKLCSLATSSKNTFIEICLDGGIGNFNLKEICCFESELLRHLPDIQAKTYYMYNGEISIKFTDSKLSPLAVKGETFLKSIFHDCEVMRTVYGIAIDEDGEFQYDPLNYSAYSAKAAGFVRTATANIAGLFAEGFEMNERCFEDGIKLLNKKYELFDFYFK